MPTLTEHEMRYSAASIQLIDRIRDLVGTSLRELALERAKSQGRALVTDEDVMVYVEQLLDPNGVDQEIRHAG